MPRKFKKSKVSISGDFIKTAQAVLTDELS